MPICGEYHDCVFSLNRFIIVSSVGFSSDILILVRFRGLILFVVLVK